MSLSDLALRRPVSLLMVYLTLLVLGGIALNRIPLEFLPDMTGPTFYVQIPYRNATPAEVEKTIAIPAEEYLQTVPNLTGVDSVSHGNACSLLLEFDWGTDLDFAYLEVKDRLDRLKKDLPKESHRYFIWKFSTSDIECVMLTFAWDGPVEELYELAEQYVKPRLQRVDGVGSVKVWGLQDSKIYIDLDQDLMKAYGISLYDLVLKLDRNNFTLASGEIYEAGKRFLVRTTNEYRTLSDLEDFRINREGLRLKDVAKIGFGLPEKTYGTRMDGRTSVSVGIKKESTANTVQVCQAIHDEMERIVSEPSMKGLAYSVIFDQAKYIHSSFRDLRDAGLWGGLFAICVLYFFLRRVLATLVIAVAIPMSIVVAVVVMFFSSMTVNVISMVGLMLGVGMLVDNSIVVSENIFRLREQGLSRMEAARLGSRDVAMAIVASTLTTIIVFLPMVFMDTGMMKVYTREVGVAISLSLLASLFVALTFIPLVASRLPREERKESRILEALVREYRRVLQWVLRHRGHVSCLLVILIVVTILVPMRMVPQKGEEGGDMRRIILDLRIAGVQERERVLEVIEQVEKILLSRKEELDIEHVYAQTGFTSGFIRVHVFLKDADESDLTTNEVRTRILELLPSVPDTEFVVPQHNSTQGGGVDEIQVFVRGEDPRILSEIVETVISRIQGIQGIQEVEADAEPGHDEIQVRVDRSLARRHLVNPLVAAQTIAFGLRGYPLKKMKAQEREIDVILQLEEEDRENVSKLKDLQLLAEDGKLVPLGVVAQFREAPGQAVIQRSGGKRTVQVRAVSSGRPLGELKKEIDVALKDLRFPPGYNVIYGQMILDLQDTRSTFLSALILSVLLIYFLLGGLFESYMHPFTILVSVPLALMGSYWIMFITQSAMDVAAFIGLILMVGIVVNNAIVIIDHMNRLRSEYPDSREEAILQAGEDRIRPVLMTASTTILGLLPLGFGGAGLGGTLMFGSLGKAVIGGLAFSTLLTLFVVPLFYTYMEDTGQALRRILSLALPRRRARKGKDPERGKGTVT